LPDARAAAVSSVKLMQLSSGVFTILISVTQTKNTKFIAVPQVSSKAGSDVTKEALNCTVSLQQLTALLTPLVSSGISFCIIIIIIILLFI